MKQKVILVFALVFALSLSACGKSEAVKEAEAAIAAIGEVTVDSQETIQKAQKMYDFLTDAEKQKVENRLVLAEAQDAFAVAVEERNAELERQCEAELSDVYKSLKEVYDSVEWFGADIYTAWKTGIYNSEKFKGANLNGSVKYLKSQISLPYEDLVWGCAYSYTTNLFGGNWEEKSEADKAKLYDAVETGTFFYYSQKSIATACVSSVIGAYTVNGTVEKVQKVLDAAASALNTIEVRDKYKEQAKMLDDFYVTISAFFDYCRNVSGNFSQAEVTINDYKNTARELKSALDRAFEK